MPKGGTCYRPGPNTYAPHVSDGQIWCCDQFAGYPGHITELSVKGYGAAEGIGTTGSVGIPYLTPMGTIAPGFASAVREFGPLAAKLVAEAPAPTLASTIATFGVEAALSAVFPVAALAPIQTARSQAMGLNLSGLLGGLGSAIGGINTSGFGNVSQILGGGLQLASAAFAPQPQVPAAPSYSYGQPYQMLAPSSQVIRSVAPAVVGGAGVAIVSKEAVKILLEKIAGALGRKHVTLRFAITMARKLGKFLTSPEAIGSAIGLTVAELALLITAHSARKTRRMNPANGHALRRAARRIKSFHRLCQHTDLIKTRHRSSYRSMARCTTCRKSPCRC